MRRARAECYGAGPSSARKCERRGNAFSGASPGGQPPDTQAHRGNTELCSPTYRLSLEGQTGCKTLFDIPPAYLSPKSGEELRRELL